MAIKATIHKANIHIADMDRGHYDELNLTIARHPSETDERMMVRIFVFALHSAESLKFTEGVAAKEDEPDIWLKNLMGDIDLWIEVGLPDEKKIKKACNRSQKVYVYPYAGRSVQTWWKPMSARLSKQENLNVVILPQEATKALAELAQKTMTLHLNVQDGQIWMGDTKNNILVEPEVVFGEV